MAEDNNNMLEENISPAVPENLQPKEDDQPNLTPEPTPPSEDVKLPQPAQIDVLDIAMPQQAEGTPGPSTAENQQETEEARTFNERVQKKRRILARSSGRKFEDIEELEARELVMNEIEKEEAKQLELQKEKSLKNAEQEAKARVALDRYKTLKQKHIERGLPFKEDPRFEDLISAQEDEAANLLKQEEDQLQAEMDRKKQEEEFQRQQEVEQEKEQVKKAENQAEAERQVAQEKVVEKVEEQKEINTELEEEDKNVNFTNFNEYWESRTTGQKIMAGVGMFLGLFSGDNKNGMDYINEQIEANIKQKQVEQELSRQDYWKEKEYALKVVDQRLKAQSNRIKNAESKMKIEKLRYDMQKAAEDARKQRAISKKLASKTGLTREEVFQLPREDQKRIVPLKNRNFLAFNTEVAKKLNNEVIPSAKASLRGLSRLKEILDMPAAEIRPTLRAEAATIKQSLKGNLRLELFGPGVMTDFESRMADKIIGDPTKILTFDIAERAKFDALIKKIKFSARDKIKQAGINLPESKNELMIKQMQKKNPKMKREIIIDALMRKGYWQDSELEF